MIKALGRWNSNAFQAYIPIPRDCLAAMTATLSHNNTAGIMEQVSLPNLVLSFVFSLLNIVQTICSSDGAMSLLYPWFIEV